MSTFLTTQEASDLLNVHPNTVLRWIKSGKIQSVRVGKTYRIPAHAIEAFLDAPRRDSARIIAVANQKGGVAKTTTTVNLAAATAIKGKRVLVVDLDPQAGCAVSLGIDSSSLHQTIYDVLMLDEVQMRDILIKTGAGFDLAPSNIDLAGAEVELKQLLASEQVLKRNLETVTSDYDFIYLDCPPSLGVITVNALTAAHELLIPMATEVMALRGLEMLLTTTERVRRVLNPRLRILGILVTKYDVRTINSREVYDYLAEKSKQAGVHLFNTYIKNSVRFIEAPNTKLPLVLYDPNHDGSRAYLQIAEEVIHD
mgnify:CR=1 FL=1